METTNYIYCICSKFGGQPYGITSFALSHTSVFFFFFFYFCFSLKPICHLKQSHLVGSILFLCPCNTTHTFFKSQRPLALHYNGSATSNTLRGKKSRLPKRGIADNLPWGLTIVVSFREPGNTTVSMTKEEKISSPPSCHLLNSIMIVQLVPTVHKTLRFFMAAVLLHACDICCSSDLSNIPKLVSTWVILVSRHGATSSRSRGFLFFIFFIEDCSGGLGSKTHSSTFLIASPYFHKDMCYTVIYMNITEFIALLCCRWTKKECDGQHSILVCQTWTDS